MQIAGKRTSPLTSLEKTPPIALSDLAKFMMLHPSYRQVLYGAARLVCGAKVIESFPPDELVRLQEEQRRLAQLQPADLASASLRAHPQSGFSSRFPKHMFPLPHGQYESFDWLNLATAREATRTNHSLQAANTISFAVVLAAEEVTDDADADWAHLSGETDADAVQHPHDPDTWLRRAGDGVMARRVEFLSEDELQQCVFEILPAKQQKWEGGSVRLSNFAGDGVVPDDRPLRLPLRPETPVRQFFHGFSEASVSNARLRHAMKQFARKHDSPHTEFQLESAWFDRNVHVFLQEQLLLDATARMNMAAVLGPIFLKLLQVAGPMAERLIEYVVPYMAQPMVVHFSGENAPGFDVLSGIVLLEEEEKGDRKVDSARAVASSKSLRKRFPDDATDVSLEKWREYVQNHRDEYEPRDAEYERKHPDEPRFSTVHAGSKPLSTTTAGKFPVKMIKELIKTLTESVTEGMSTLLSVGVHEDVFNQQIDDMRDGLRDAVVDAMRSTIPAAIEVSVPRAVPDLLERIVPYQLVNHLSTTIGTTLTRALTHSISQPLAIIMSRPTEEEYVCSQCYYYEGYCDMCSWTVKKRDRLLQHVDQLGAYYSDMFGAYYTEGDKAAAKALGFPDHTPFDWQKERE